ncbi:MAG: DUF2147 domain-containing protein [Bacteroidales bacterium]
MKNYLLIIGFLLVAAFTATAQTGGNKIIGVWCNETNTVHIEFLQSGNSYSGKIVWMDKPNDENGKLKTDKYNPDSKLHSRAIMGLSIIWNLKYQNSQWVGGSIYNPPKGLTASCEIEMPDSNTLKVKASKGLFSTVKTWKRIK